MPVELYPSQNSLFYNLHQSEAAQRVPSKYKLHEKFPNLELAPDKINIRESLVHPGTYSELCDAVVWAIEEALLRNKVPIQNVEAVVGVPEVGNHLSWRLAKRLSILTDKPVAVFELEKEQLADGKRRVTDRITQSSEIPNGHNTLIVDDVLSSGKSIKETGDALKRIGLKPWWAATGMDRMLFGDDLLENEGFKVTTATDILAFYRFSVAQNFITDEERKESLRFLANAQAYISGAKK